MNKSIRRLITAIFFAILSLPWFYGAHLALAQNAQPTPTTPVKQVPIGEILKFGENTDWCRTGYVMGSLLNLQELAEDFTPEEATRVTIEVITSQGDVSRLNHATVGLSPVKNFISKQRLLKAAYVSCKMFGVIGDLLKVETSP